MPTRSLWLMFSRHGIINAVRGTPRHLPSIWLLILNAALLGALLGSCSRWLTFPVTPTVTALQATTPSPTPSQPPTPTPTPAVISLWIAPSVPEGLRDHIQAAVDTLGGELELSATEEGANLIFGPEGAWVTSEWIYALAAPFASIAESVNLGRLKAIWQGSDSGVNEIFLAPETLLTLEAVLGKSTSDRVHAFRRDALLI